MKFKVGDIAVLVKPKDLLKSAGWDPSMDGMIGSHVEISSVWPDFNRTRGVLDRDIYVFNDPIASGVQVSVYGDWLEPTVSVTLSGGMTTIRSSVNPSEWYPSPSVSEKPRTDREFDGHCDKASFPEWTGWCGGFRKHKLGCPQKKKESSA